MINKMAINGKLLFCLVLSVIMAVCILWPGPATGAEIPLKGESAILLDAHSGKILFEKDPHKIMYPASMTKLMTLVIAMEALAEGKVKMDDIVTASENAASYGGSQIYLASGEELTFREMLLGIAMASGNDASVAVAEYIAGTHEEFVNLMNKKAAELGLKNTNFVNCNGLHDPNHYSTAYDFAQIGLYALRYPEIREICSVKHYRIREGTRNPFQFDNKNKLLWFYSGTDGFKTGWTVDAKYCFTGTCERNGLRFVSVVMGVPVMSGHFADTQMLYNWGYSQYIFKEFYKENETIGEVTVGKGAVDSVRVIPKNKVGVTVLKGKDKDITVSVELQPTVSAPLQKGEIVGHVSVIQNGQVLTRTDLLARDSVEKGTWWRQFNKVIKTTVTG